MARTVAASIANRRSSGLVLAALGVVYGDIGTSPLYALRECFHGPHAVAPTPAHVLGVLSLIVWSLVLVISVKYLALILRADNEGEGGILALMALVCDEAPGRAPWMLVVLGLFGAALLYGDGMITPAISVLSAVEGLEVVTPALGPYVVPLTLGLLFALFALQRRGTASIGAVFGPLTLLWFVCIGALGAWAVARSPAVLAAIDPRYAVRFFQEGGARAFMVLGSVFLVVTGGEALYADMGHFGRAPIRRAWFSVVLPALTLNYLGQGALLLDDPGAAGSPFYHLAPGWARLPLVALATGATLIASQAVITGAFSLTWQAIQLGYLPRFHVRHTSEEEMGQIYIPDVSWGLFLCASALVLGFRTSSSLAAAYGIAVTTTMVITTVLAYVAMRRLWGWSRPLAGAVAGGLLAFDLAFFAANVLKIADGGWVPLSIGVAILTVMTTWRTGRRILRDRLAERALPIEALAGRLAAGDLVRVAGTGVYLTSRREGTPPALSRTLRHLPLLHERALLVTVVTDRRPYALPSRRASVEEVLPGVLRIVLTYGFMERPNLPLAIRRLRELGLDVDLETATYFLARETLLATDRPGMALWRERLFAYLSRNASRATEFFRIPPEQVLEIGAQIEL